MSIKRINEFPEGSGSLSNDDLFIFMDDSSGSGVTKKITLSQLFAAATVKSIAGSGNISVSSVSGNFTIGSSGLIKSDITGITAASGISNMIQISQANYDALVTKDSSTLYVIT